MWRNRIWTLVRFLPILLLIGLAACGYKSILEVEDRKPMSPLMKDLVLNSGRIGPNVAELEKRCHNPPYKMATGFRDEKKFEACMVAKQIESMIAVVRTPGERATILERHGFVCDGHICTLHADVDDWTYFLFDRKRKFAEEQQLFRADLNTGDVKGSIVRTVVGVGYAL